MQHVYKTISPKIIGKKGSKLQSIGEPLPHTSVVNCIRKSSLTSTCRKSSNQCINVRLEHLPVGGLAPGGPRRTSPQHVYAFSL